MKGPSIAEEAQMQMLSTTKSKCDRRIALRTACMPMAFQLCSTAKTSSLLIPRRLAFMVSTSTLKRSTTTQEVLVALGIQIGAVIQII